MLDERGLAEAVSVLCQRDRVLQALVGAHGPPPLWAREPGFRSLVQIILEQQVSLASGRAALVRLEVAAGEISPDRLAGLDVEQAREAGLTRQKSRYVIELSQAIVSGSFDLTAVNLMTDDEARSALTALVGIGDWTANVYLLLALRRPDIWPTGDLAAYVAMRRALQLDAGTPRKEMDRLAERWSPFRATAARILWKSYLKAAGRQFV